jgi:hypothetical protein
MSQYNVPKPVTDWVQKAAEQVGGFFSDLFRGSDGSGMNNIPGAGVTELTPEQATQAYNAGVTTNRGFSSVDSRQLNNNVVVADAGGGGGETGGGETGGGETGGGETGGGETGGGPTLGEIKVINGASYSWDGTRWVLIETGGGSGGSGGTGSGTVGGTVVETPPKEGDFKAGADGQPLIFKNGRWEVYGARNTREIITEDPATVAAREQEMAGADANVPIDKYMESLGTDTLAGKAYAEALARRMASIDEQQRTAGLSYGDMYEQARMSQAARRGMSDVSGMTGGMADQAQSRMSAAEIASLGQIGMGREATMRQLEMAQLNAPMEAFQEGAQMDQFERARQTQSTQMQQAQTLFEQAQSGWVQNEDGTWTNIDKQTQDTLSLQAINATQRAEVLGEIQYWQAVLADSNQASLHEVARENISTLQMSYGNLLANNPVTSGGPSGTPPPGPGPEPGPEPEGFTINTGQTTPVAGKAYVQNKLTNLGITDETSLPGMSSDIRTVTDLSSRIYDLAGNKAVEGYNFADELDLVDRYLNDPTTLTNQEYESLKDAKIVPKQSSLMTRLGIRTTVESSAGRYREIYTIPITPETAGFVQFMLDKKYIDEDKLKDDDANVYSFSDRDLNKNADIKTVFNLYLEDKARGGVSASPIDIFG